MILCRRCDRELEICEVTAEWLRGRCAHCDKVYRFAPAVAEELPMPCPKGVSLIEDGACPRLVWRWFAWPALYLVFLCLFWNAVVHYAVWRIYEESGQLFFVWAVPHGWLAIGLIYASLAYLLNRTSIGLTPERLRVSHGPIPWWRDRSLNAGDIVNVRAETTFKGRRGGMNYYIYHVTAVLEDGGEVRLLRIHDRRYAIYFKQQLESWLDLTPDRSRSRAA